MVFGQTLLEKAGLAADRAEIVSTILVEGDLLGHYTHGLNLLPAYVKEIEAGHLVLTGDPEILVEGECNAVIDGHYLPGPFLVNKALEMCYEKMKTMATSTVVIRRSHHIACLGSYLKRITDQGYVGIILSSDPNNASIAPYGSYEPSYSPNPIAVGIPTNKEPILIDMSTSSTANGVVAKYRQEGKLLPDKWVLTNTGEPTNNPNLFFTTPPGSILPLGGMDLGYKGFALGILVEALSSALGGFGRADYPTHWGASVFVQTLNPKLFAGLDAFTKESTFFADSCTSKPPFKDGKGVFMPGAFELKNWEKQSSEGVELTKHIVESLALTADAYGVPLPKEIS